MTAMFFVISFFWQQFQTSIAQTKRILVLKNQSTSVKAMENRTKAMRLTTPTLTHNQQLTNHSQIVEYR